MPSLFKINSSSCIMNDLFTRWSPAKGLTMELAELIHTKTGKPAGIITIDMQGAAVKNVYP